VRVRVRVGVRVRVRVRVGVRVGVGVRVRVGLLLDGAAVGLLQRDASRGELGGGPHGAGLLALEQHIGQLLQPHAAVRRLGEGEGKVEGEGEGYGLGYRGTGRVRVAPCVGTGRSSADRSSRLPPSPGRPPA
jgi:hypothetical protein